MKSITPLPSVAALRRLRWDPFIELITNYLAEKETPQAEEVELILTRAAPSSIRHRSHEFHGTVRALRVANTLLSLWYACCQSEELSVVRKKIPRLVGILGEYVQVAGGVELFYQRDLKCYEEAIARFDPDVCEGRLPQAPFIMSISALSKGGSRQVVFREDLKASGASEEEAHVFVADTPQ